MNLFCGAILLIVACLACISQVSVAVSANGPIIISDIDGFDVTVANGRVIAFDHEDAINFEIPAYPDRKFQVSIVTLNNFLTELAFMEADGPISVNETFDAEDLLRGWGWQGMIRSYDCTVSGHKTRVLCPDIQGNTLYVAVVKLGEVAKMSIANKGDHGDFNKTISLIKITPSTHI